MHLKRPQIWKLSFSTLLLMVWVGLFASCAESPTPPSDDPGDPAPPDAPAGLLPLPEFVDCTNTTHPELPAKWVASGLLQDFFLPTLWYAGFVYDEAAEAFRFSLADRYGIDFDFLTTTDGRLYLLEDGGAACSLLTSSSPFTVPARDWLAAQAVCVGQAEILEQDQEWWKSPSGVGANWFWYNSTSRMPFRSMYYADAKPTTPVPIYEHFTFNYFPTFESVEETDLASLVQMCEGTAEAATATDAYSKPSIEPLLAKSTYPEPSGAMDQIQEWIPGISTCSSTGDLPPMWPDQLQMTAFMTAVSFDPNPFPTRIYYDYTQLSQNTTLYYYPPTVEDYAQVALLLDDTGYIAFQREDGTYSSCEQALPGPPVPNWKTVDGCECRAQIAPNTVLNPSGVPTKVLWCPTDLEAKQVFWTWYSDTGTPIVFMQSNSSPTAGTGLNLADYYAWGPGSVAPAGTFDLPTACDGQPKQPDAFPQACNNCHLPLNNPPDAG